MLYVFTTHRNAVVVHAVYDDIAFECLGFWVDLARGSGIEVWNDKCCVVCGYRSLGGVAVFEWLVFVLIREGHCSFGIARVVCSRWCTKSE